jgi:hypothetical protein
MPNTAAVLDSLIERLKIKREDDLADVMVFVWVRLCRKVTSLAGKGTFASLYEINLYRSAMSFPSLVKHVKGRDDLTIGHLKDAIQDMDDEAKAKPLSIALLVSFIELLNSLVGRTQTNKILVQAWGKDFLGREESSSTVHYIHQPLET